MCVWSKHTGKVVTASCWGVLLWAQLRGDDIIRTGSTIHRFDFFGIEESTIHYIHSFIPSLEERRVRQWNSKQQLIKAEGKTCQFLGLRYLAAGRGTLYRGADEPWAREDLSASCCLWAALPKDLGRERERDEAHVSL